MIKHIDSGERIFMKAKLAYANEGGS